MIAELQNGCAGGGLEEPAELVRLTSVNKGQDHPLKAAWSGPNDEHLKGGRKAVRRPPTGGHAPACYTALGCMGQGLCFSRGGKGD